MTDLTTVGVLRVDSALDLLEEEGRSGLRKEFGHLVDAEPDDLGLHDAVLVEGNYHGVWLVQDQLDLRVHMEEVCGQDLFINIDSYT